MAGCGDTSTSSPQLGQLRSFHPCSLSADFNNLVLVLWNWHFSAWSSWCCQIALGCWSLPWRVAWSSPASQFSATVCEYSQGKRFGHLDRGPCSGSYSCSATAIFPFRALTDISPQVTLPLQDQIVQMDYEVPDHHLLPSPPFCNLGPVWYRHEQYFSFWLIYSRNTNWKYLNFILLLHLDHPSVLSSLP